MLRLRLEWLHVQQCSEVTAVRQRQALPQRRVVGAWFVEEIQVVAFADQQIDLVRGVVGIDLSPHGRAQPLAFKAQGIGDRPGDREVCRQVLELVGSQVQHERFADLVQALRQLDEAATGQEQGFQLREIAQVRCADQRVVRQVQLHQPRVAVQCSLGAGIPGNAVAVQVQPVQLPRLGQARYTVEAAIRQHQAPEVGEAPGQWHFRV
ncbi:hypothetical protein EGJ22_01375 [Pseudomonas sp. p99-361]|nr:hypothetical protein EGJ22_01375 [Pseudomonas sp. p99-361]